MAEVLWTLAVLFGAIALAGVITWGATGRYRREAAQRRKAPSEGQDRG